MKKNWGRKAIISTIVAAAGLALTAAFVVVREYDLALAAFAITAGVATGYNVTNAAITRTALKNGNGGQRFYAEP